MYTEFAIIGAGGHAKVVADSVLALNPNTALRVFDQNSLLSSTKFLNLVDVEVFDLELILGLDVHVAIGANQDRERLFQIFEQQNLSLPNVIHPAATVSCFCELGAGSFAAAHCVVAPSVSIGKGVVINHSSVIDHDVKVGNFSHVAPNATIGGGVSVGCRVLVGAGATVLPGVSIADDAVIGAGAVVTRNVNLGQTVFGAPARKVIK